jgi:hypothetical protein
MARAADKLWTLEDFLAFDDGTDTSYQLFEGRLVSSGDRSKKRRRRTSTPASPPSPGRLRAARLSAP